MDFPVKYSTDRTRLYDIIDTEYKSDSFIALFQSMSAEVFRIPFDTSNVTNMTNMLSSCGSLKCISSFDTSNATNMRYMFNNCRSLIAIPWFDTSKVSNMSNMFSGCSALRSIPQLDTSKVTNISLAGYNTLSSLVDLGGFVNLGAQNNLSGTSGSYFLGQCPNLTHDSIMNVINNLYDRKTAGYSVLTLKLHANTMALLSDEEKAIATNKGWTLS